MNLTESERYCFAQVRRHDHDRYLTALFLASESRADALALYAFNQEVARSREIVSEPLLGQIRLQWWRETIEGIYANTPREHPVVEALGVAIARHDLPHAAFDSLIDAREADLEDGPRESLHALEVYARDTSGELAALVMQTLEPGNSLASDTARRVGTAWALVGLARSVVFHAQSQRLYIPEALLSEYEIERRRLFDLKPSSGLNRAIKRMIDLAASHLDNARSVSGEMSRAARRGLLLASLADRHIAAIRKVGYDPFAIPAGDVAPVLRLAWTAWRGRY
ncbi:MAG: phytoene synthase [Alphaproteobacteria bacterium]|nr:phytoene synthase [Alphaproteobacteria bacterium]|tara:strand:- start:897 stop:1739 length:843 start_codon:yes stop_codon:yes gene_type:complete